MKIIFRIAFEWIFLLSCPLFFGAILLAFLPAWIWFVYCFIWILIWDEGKIFKHIP